MLSRRTYLAAMAGAAAAAAQDFSKIGSVPWKPWLSSKRRKFVAPNSTNEDFPGSLRIRKMPA